MRELAALQAQFGAALDATASEARTPEIFAGNSEQVGQRLGIYRGNTRANTAKALSAAYPVIKKIVGEGFFSGLAGQYQSRFASIDGDLNEYGDAFAAFLAEFAPAQEIPYLADVAHLEWRVHRAHYAADSRPFDPTRLAGVLPERQGLLRPRLQPACHVLRSAYPIARIWEVHQEAFGGEFEVDFAGDSFNALVYRPRFRVEVARIADTEAAFLEAARDGKALDAALALARKCDASFDLTRSLREWVESSVIFDFELDAEQ